MNFLPVQKETSFETQNGMEITEPIFPIDININDVREAIKDRTDFRECEYEDHIIFVYFLGMGLITMNCSISIYIVAAKDIFPDPDSTTDTRTRYLWKLRRECRGIVFSKSDGKVIGRRFHKFFNGSHFF
jgi:hypothetical protein